MGCQFHRAGPVECRDGLPYSHPISLMKDPVGLLGLGGGAEFEALDVGGAGPVEGLAGPPGVEADDVDGGGGDVVLEPGFGQAGVACGADAGDVGGLADGALDSGADLVAVFPFPGVLPGAGGGDGVVG